MIEIQKREKIILKLKLFFDSSQYLNRDIFKTAWRLWMDPRSDLHFFSGNSRNCICHLSGVWNKSLTREIDFKVVISVWI